MDVGVRDTQELIFRPRAILSTANTAMPNNIMLVILRAKIFSPSPVVKELRIAGMTMIILK